MSQSNAEGAVFVPHVLGAGLTEQKSLLDIKYILYFMVVKKILLSCQKYLTVRFSATKTRDVIPIKKNERPFDLSFFFVAS
jgi:hypothetical protein